MGSKPVSRNSKKAVAPPSLLAGAWAQLQALPPNKLRLLTAVALLMLMGGASLWFRAWLNNPANLTLAQIDWQGDFRYLNRAELEQIAKPFVAGNLYLLDAAALELALEAHPWVRDVSLRKIWPSQLVVQVETQFPIAFWGDDQLLNQFGEIYAGTLPEKQGVFPIIHSPQANGREMAERYVRLRQTLKGLDLDITELSEDERGSWRMRLRHGPEVVIGRKEQERRLQRFRVGYESGLRKVFGQIDRVDLRYTNGFAVEWKPGVKKDSVSSLEGQAQRSFGS